LETLSLVKTIPASKDEANIVEMVSLGTTAKIIELLEQDLPMFLPFDSVGMGYSLGVGSLPVEDLCMVEVECANTTNIPASTFPAKYWTLHFDGARCHYGVGACVIFTSPEGKFLPFAFKLNFKCTNNGAEYKALLLGLILAKRISVNNIRVLGDSKLVANQVSEIYETKAEHLQLYETTVLDLSKEFDFISSESIP
ncbi:hypothetical protein KI387_043819, partial [Taxus chinensis]